MVMKFYLIRLNRYCMGRPTLCVPGTSYIDAYTDLSAVVVEGIGLHVEDILVSLVLSKNYILDIYDSDPSGKPIQLCLQNIRPIFV